MHKFKVGQQVLWQDPDPIDGQEWIPAIIAHVQHEEDDAVILLDRYDGGETEALPHELTAPLTLSFRNPLFPQASFETFEIQTVVSIEPAGGGEEYFEHFRDAELLKDKQIQNCLYGIYGKNANTGELEHIADRESLGLALILLFDLGVIGADEAASLIS